MPVTSRRGTLREDMGVYKQITFWTIGGREESELRYVLLSPTRWQEMYREAHMLRGAKIHYSGGRAAIAVPVGGREMLVVASDGLGDDQFIVSRDRWDPSSGV